jgi:endothelin-converting enzyme/putative endopeptidase
MNRLLVAIAVVLAGRARGEETPLKSLPYTPSLDVTAMDRSVDPCSDFYAFSCGGWIKANPIPADQPRWDVYRRVYTENQRFLWDLLEEAAGGGASRSAEQQKIGDYFASCMDEGAVEKAGTGPLKADLAAIDALESTGAIAGLLGRLHLTVTNGDMLFATGSDQDRKDSTRYIFYVYAGGLGLPERDYYLNDDPSTKDVLAKYRAHLRRSFDLLGEPEEKASADAETVVAIETALARASLSAVDRRDPYKTYHPMSRAELRALVPSFRWDDYLQAAGLPDVQDLAVSQPAFLKEVEAGLRGRPLADWKTYLRWHLLSARSAYLSSAFESEDFKFYQGVLNGVKEMPPRWKRCVSYVDRDLGEALGRVFVARVFPPEAKAATVEMVQRVEAAMERRIRELDWMADETRAHALEKLAAMRNKVGYPESWRDYSSLRVERSDFAGNVSRAVVFESRRQLAKIGRPLDRGEWTMTPPTVNAYYNPSMNDMNFPAGVLLPPLLDLKRDLAPSYGNTGSTIGHELTHGFDDSGRQYDARGNLADWWTEKDAKEFDKRTSCIADQYAQYPVVGEVKIQSRLTLGEDVADLGGTILAYHAWKDATRGQTLGARDGLTPDQRFFVGFAQWACGSEREESARLLAQTDPHSPLRWRIDGVVPNMPEFRAAFSCKAGQPMVREPVCRVW